jgi:hypothetical protein
MKRYYYWAVSVAFVGVVSFCLLAPHVSRATSVQTNDAPAEEDPYKRALEVYNAQAKQAEEQAKRSEALLARGEVFLKQQEEAFKRYEKILDTWERQQQEYQKYLDTLPKK